MYYSTILSSKLPDVFCETDGRSPQAFRSLGAFILKGEVRCHTESLPCVLGSSSVDDPRKLLCAEGQISAQHKHNRHTIWWLRALGLCEYSNASTQRGYRMQANR